MRVKNVSFRGYKEINNAKFVDPYVKNVLNEARPYLRQIGNSMPYPRDLMIEITEDECDTFISAYDYNNKNKKMKLLARKNEHTLTEHGLYFVQNVFEGLEKNSKSEFKEIATNFVKRLYWVQNEQYPIKPLNLPSDPYYDPHP